MGDLETIFSIAGAVAGLGWLLLILSPKRWPWLLATTGIAIPAGLALVYAALILPNIAAGDGGFGSLAEVRLLFANDALLLGGWIHYLAFDLAIGTHIAMVSDRIGVLRLVQAPLLLLTFMLGPIGYFLFLLTRGFLALRYRSGDD